MPYDGPVLSVRSQRPGIETVVALAVALAGVLELVAGIAAIGVVLLALATGELWAIRRRRLQIDTEGLELRKGVSTHRLPWARVAGAHLERPMLTGFRCVIVTDDRGRMTRISGIGAPKRGHREDAPTIVDRALDAINGNAGGGGNRRL